QPDLAPVRSGLTIRRVVHLEDDVRAGPDELSAAVRQHGRRHAGRITDKKIGIALFRFLPVVLRNKWNAFLNSFHPLGAWRPHPGDHMMNHGAVAWPYFRHLHPGVV